MATLIRKIEEQTEGIGMDRREAHEGIQMGRKGRRKRKQKKVKVGTQKTRSHKSEKNINHCKQYGARCQGWGKKGWWTRNGRFEFKVERRLA